MENKEKKEKKTEKGKFFSDFEVKEKHLFEIRLKKPFEGNYKKQELFMDMTRKIKKIHLINGDDSFMIEISHLRTWGEVKLFVKYEFEKVFKATEKAFKELE